MFIWNVSVLGLFICYSLSKNIWFYFDMDIYLFYGGFFILFNILWDIKLNFMVLEKIYIYFLKIENIVVWNFFYFYWKFV